MNKQPYEQFTYSRRSMFYKAESISLYCHKEVFWKVLEEVFPCSELRKFRHKHEVQHSKPTKASETQR